MLDDLVRALFEQETLDRAAVAEVFQPLRLWPKRPAWTGSDTRVPSQLPPVTPPPPVGERAHQRPRTAAAGHGQDGPPGGEPLPPGTPGTARTSRRSQLAGPAGSRRSACRPAGSLAAGGPTRRGPRVRRRTELAAGGPRLPVTRPTSRTGRADVDPIGRPATGRARSTTTGWWRPSGRS